MTRWRFLSAKRALTRWGPNREKSNDQRMPLKPDHGLLSPFPISTS